jgi:hypothetical protein
VIDKQLKYSNHSKQRVQGEGDMSLRNLLSTSKLPVYFNDYKYQRDGNGVNTCGRHVANFIKYNLEQGLDLEDYNELMMKTQKETGLPYDELIAKMVPIHIPHPDDATRVTSSADIQAQRGLGGAKPFVSGRGFFDEVVEKYNRGDGKPFTNKQLTKIILDKNKVIADLEENAYGGGIRGVAW